MTLLILIIFSIGFLATIYMFSWGFGWVESRRKLPPPTYNEHELLHTPPQEWVRLAELEFDNQHNPPHQLSTRSGMYTASISQGEYVQPAKLATCNHLLERHRAYKENLPMERRQCPDCKKYLYLPVHQTVPFFLRLS